MDIEALLPFPLLGFDSDNGGEFINRALVNHFAERSVCFTRSRPYRSNDNAHVEQKNYTHVRQLLGYKRLDNPTAVPLLNDVLRNEFSLLRNHFYPTRKLLSKTVIGGKTTRSYDKPQTPYERVLLHPLIPELKKEQLRAQHKSLNPIKLQKQIKAKIRRILRVASVTPFMSQWDPQGALPLFLKTVVGRAVRRKFKISMSEIYRLISDISAEVNMPTNLKPRLAVVDIASTNIPGSSLKCRLNINLRV